MAILTGKVQLYKGSATNKKELGKPFAYKNSKGEWVDMKGSPIKVVTSKFIERLKERIKNGDISRED